MKVDALRAQREREIEEAMATEAAAIQHTKLLQAQAVEEEIRKRLAIPQKEIEASIELAEKNKLLKVVQAQQLQEAEIAEINRQQQVEANRLQAQVTIAESERLARLAQEDVAMAVATKKKESLMAKAARARAESAVATAIEVEKAERQKNLAIIAPEREAAEKHVLEQNVVEIDIFRRRRQAEIVQQVAKPEAEAIRTLAEANRDQAIVEAAGIEALLAAKNVISNANLVAQVITSLWPELARQLPEVLKALVPQPSMIGDAKIYAFPSANGAGTPEISQLLLSTSGLALINALFEEGKLGALLAHMKSLLQDSPTPEASSRPSRRNC